MNPKKNKSWFYAAELSELKENFPHKVTIDKTEVFLLRRGNEVIAVSNDCPHLGAPLNEGFVSGDQVVCPWHNARFNLNNGEPVSPPALEGLPVYESRVEEGAVFIRFHEKSRRRQIKLTDPRVIVIIGAGAAGISAAETLRRKGFAGKIQMLTREKSLPYDRTLLSKPYLSGKSTDKDLPLKPKSYFEENQIELITGVHVTGIDLNHRQIHAYAGKPYVYTQCLLATGGIPRRAGIPGEDLGNIIALRTWDDARKIRSGLNKVIKVLVVGAGFIGLEAAAYLREAGIQVHLVAPETELLEPVFGRQAGRFLRKQHELHGVRLHLGCTVRRFSGDKHGHVREAELSDDTLLPVELVIEGLGIDPAIDYLKDTDLPEEGAVPVNGRMQTAHPEIFAAGDIARIPDPVTGKPHRFEHWVEAERQGKHAALCMLGHDADYDEVPFFWTRQYNRSLKYVGNAPNFDSVAVYGNVEEGDFLTGYYFENQLLAAASIGMDAALFEAEKYLKRGENISAERFASGNLR